VLIDPVLPTQGSFDAVFNLILFIVIGGFVYAIGSFIWQTVTNMTQPVLSRWARVVGRREDTSGGGEEFPVHTWYYITFEFADGSREEFTVTGRQFGMLREGDAGTLRSQGSWFQGFERDPAQTHRESV
jgi:hypothetical protein